MFWTCGETDKPFCDSDSKYLMISTRWSSDILAGERNFSFRFLSTKIISQLFAKFSYCLQQCDLTQPSLYGRWQQGWSVYSHQHIYKVHSQLKLRASQNYLQRMTPVQWLSPVLYQLIYFWIMSDILSSYLVWCECTSKKSTSRETDYYITKWVLVPTYSLARYKSI